MQKTNSRLDHLTLRDLRLLSIWLETLSVTRTAEMFALSQPATSRIIAKLRRVLADPLVVRTPLGAAATPRALLLIPEIDATLLAVERTFAPLAFDPLNATSRIKIAATDYGATFAVAPFAARLSTTAPRIRLETSGFTSDTFSALADGSVDMALYADAQIPPGFHSIDLFEERYAWLMRSGHPLLSSAHSDVADSISNYPRAVMLFPDGRQLLHDDIIAELANEDLPPASFASPFFMSLGPAIAASEMVACIPERAAHHIASGNELRWVAAPVATGFTYRLIWHERTNHDPEQKWLRLELQTLFSK